MEDSSTYKKLICSITIALILASSMVVLNSRTALGDTPLLVDPDFNASVDSADLRTNSVGQDWFESRGAFSGADPTRLTLNDTNIGGDATKKAQLANYGGTASSQAYLTQDFSSNQTGVFDVSFDIYISRIETTSTYPLANRTGHIYLGDDVVKTNAITGTSNERFVYFAFYDSTPNVGNDLEIRARTLSTQLYAETSQWVQVATGLSYANWYRVKLVVNVTAGTYDIYVDGILKTASIPKYGGYAESYVQYITFSADGDARGDYFIDNVYAPAQDTQLKIVSDQTQVIVGQDFTVYLNVTNVIDLYGWEFQFDYNPSVLDLTYNDTVADGLNTPVNVFKSLANEVTGHVWWAVSTAFPNTTGLTHTAQAIFEMHFKAIAVGSSNLDLSGTILANSKSNPILHTVVNGSVNVMTRDLKVNNVEICNMYANETWTHSIYANDSYVNLTQYYYPVNVTIENTGTLSAGSFKVKLEVFFDLTLEASAELAVSDLAGLSSKELTFTGLFCPTKTGDPAKYSLKATVDSENTVVEDNEGNNGRIKNDFMVTIMGDVNGDKKVNILDGVKIALAWSGTPGSSQWNVAADLNHNNVVNVQDGIRTSSNWGLYW